jgi:hypothetical protein
MSVARIVLLILAVLLMITGAYGSEDYAAFVVNQLRFRGGWTLYAPGTWEAIHRSFWLGIPMLISGLVLAAIALRRRTAGVGGD